MSNSVALQAEAGWARIRRVCNLLRFRPFDVTTPEGRSAERHRRIALSSMASIAARGVGVIYMFITVRLTARYLGNERYGLWMTISSLVALFAFADLGIGNGLVNAISDADGRDDTQTAARHVSSGFFMLGMVALLLGAVFFGSYPFVSWPRVFNVHSPDAMAEAGPSMIALTLCFLLNLPMGIVARVQMGYQDGFVASLWTIAGQTLGFAFVLVVIWKRLGLPWLILAVAGSPLIAAGVNALILFAFQRRYLLPRLTYVSMESVRRLFNIGLLFLMLQICVSMAFFADNIVAAQVLGAESVAQYSVPMRLFSIPSLLISMVTGALWPAYAEARARGDVSWIARTLRRSIRLSLALSIPSALLLLLLYRPIIQFWVGPQIQPTLWLIAGMASWTVMGSVGQALAMFLNGLHIFRFQLIVGLAMAVFNLVLSVLLARWIGLPGVIWGTVISYGVLTLIPCWFHIPRILRNLQSQPPQEVEHP